MLTHVISLMLEDAIKMHDNASTLLALLTAVGGGGCTMGFHEWYSKCCLAWYRTKHNKVFCIDWQGSADICAWSQFLGTLLWGRGWGGSQLWDTFWGSAWVMKSIAILHQMTPCYSLFCCSSPQDSHSKIYSYVCTMQFKGCQQDHTTGE